VKLFPNFTIIPVDYLLISWVTNYVRNREFLTCLSWFKRICDRELHSLKNLELKLSDFFDKRPVRIFLDVLFRVFRFSKGLFTLGWGTSGR